MRFLTRSLLALFLTALTVGLLAYAGHVVFSALQERAEGADRRPMQRERAFNVQVVPFEPGEVAPVLAAFGEVRTRRALELRAPIAGRVLELAPGFEDGARVSAGQLLLRMDPADAQTALERARSDMRRAEAELRDADRALDLAAEDVAAATEQLDLRRRAFERLQNLAGRGIATDAQLEDAELALSSARQALVSRRQAEAQAEARLEAAETALERERIALVEAQRLLADTELHARFDGVLADVEVVEGGQVSAGERLARVIDDDALEVALRVSTTQFLRLLDEDGALIPTAVEVTLDMGESEITSPAELTRASATVAEGQSGRVLFARLEAPRGFRPGDFVTVRVEEPALTEVARLPGTAVTAQDTVLALGPDNRLEAHAVEVLRRQGDDVILRAAAELAGRELVREVGPMLGEGILVEPTRPETAQAEDTPAMVRLDAERRAELIARVESNNSMPAPVRARLIGQLEQDEVPARMLERLDAGPQGG